MNSGTEQLTQNITRINEMEEGFNLSWAWDGLDTEPYAVLNIEDSRTERTFSGRIRGTMLDLTALTGEMVESLEAGDVPAL